MGGVQEGWTVSFLEIERKVLDEVMALGQTAMTKALEQLDELIYAARDRERYVVKDVRERELETLVGVVRFKRRYYLDRGEGRFVALLDERLGLADSVRISAGLEELAVFQGMQGPSYRKAEAGIRAAYARPVMSHETIRRRVLKTGQRIAEVEARRQAAAQGTRKVPVIFLEVDGLYAHGQQPRGGHEYRIATVHEGWERPQPGSETYRLRNVSYCIVRRDHDVWDEISRHVYSIYDVAGTVVVINGDRANWIRDGVKFFSNARLTLYQIDRFHLVRDVRQLLAHQPALRRQALDAVARSDAEALLRHLRAAQAAEPDADRAMEMRAFCRDLQHAKEATRDYRVRLAERGLSLPDLRGLGAAEPNMDRFANRLKKRGQSWSIAGARAMLNALAKSFEGELWDFVRGTGGDQLITEPLQRAKRVAQETLSALLPGVVVGHMPAGDSGRNGSAGLSRFVHRISRPGNATA